MERIVLMNTTIGRFFESKVHEGYAALEERYEEDGYLFFRGALDSADVEKSRNTIASVLERLGLIEPGKSEPEWTGMPYAEIDVDEVLGAAASIQTELCESPRTVEVLEGVFGEPV